MHPKQVILVSTMLQLSKTLFDQEVWSLRTGAPVAIASTPIMNPNNLKIEGFHCIDRFSNDPLILLTQDIREHIAKGFVIDDHEVLAEIDDLVRLQPLIELAFDLIGKAVYTDKKKRLGKITDFAVDDATLYVQKIYVGQSIVKSLTAGQLSVDRSQIVEITDTKIIIKDPLQGVKEAAPAPLAA
jgi:sporulation protein YlmC with PRC-barrel domain